MILDLPKAYQLCLKSHLTWLMKMSQLWPRPKDRWSGARSKTFCPSPSLWFNKWNHVHQKMWVAVVSRSSRNPMYNKALAAFPDLVVCVDLVSVWPFLSWDPSPRLVQSQLSHFYMWVPRESIKAYTHIQVAAAAVCARGGGACDDDGRRRRSSGESLVVTTAKRREEANNSQPRLHELLCSSSQCLLRFFFSIVVDLWVNAGSKSPWIQSKTFMSPLFSASKWPHSFWAWKGKPEGRCRDVVFYSLRASSFAAKSVQMFAHPTIQEWELTTQNWQVLCLPFVVTTTSRIWISEKRTCIFIPRGLNKAYFRSVVH